MSNSESFLEILINLFDWFHWNERVFVEETGFPGTYFYRIKKDFKEHKESFQFTKERVATFCFAFYLPLELTEIAMDKAGISTKKIKESGEDNLFLFWYAIEMYVGKNSIDVCNDFFKAAGLPLLGHNSEE